MSTCIRRRGCRSIDWNLTILIWTWIVHMLNVSKFTQLINWLNEPCNSYFYFNFTLSIEDRATYRSPRVDVRAAPANWWNYPVHLGIVSTLYNVNSPTGIRNESLIGHRLEWSPIENCIKWINTQIGIGHVIGCNITCGEAGGAAFLPKFRCLVPYSIRSRRSSRIIPPGAPE